MQKISGLLDQIKKAQAKLDFKNGEECFYRGHANSTWSLAPSLLRKKFKDDKERFWTESALFYEFSTRAKQLHQQNLDDWDMLIYMRHHGVPTRLIDWTETLGVALYFAVLDYNTNNNTNPCIWLLNPYALNAISWGGRDLVNPKYLLEHPKTKFWTYGDFMAADWVKFQWKYPVAIYPPQKSGRMQAQRGCFTIHGTDKNPMNKMAKVQRFIQRINITPDMRYCLKVQAIKYIFF